MEFKFDDTRELASSWHKVHGAIRAVDDLANRVPTTDLEAAYKLGRVGEVSDRLGSAFHQFGVNVEAEIETTIAAKDNAYRERNQLIAFIARVLAGSGYTVGLGKHDPEDQEWEEDWRNIVYMELPSGQVSWHIHDSELEQFAWLPPYEKPWDGHDTPEKYRRLANAGI